MKKIAIPVHTEYLDKEQCLAAAGRILRDKKIEGMSRKKLAEELYFHATIHDICVRTGLFHRVRRHADPIDLRDGGDNVLMRACYAVLWKIRR